MAVAADPQDEEGAGEVGGEAVVVVTVEEGPCRVVGEGGGGRRRHRRPVSGVGAPHDDHGATLTPPRCPLAAPVLTTPVSAADAVA
jgi:hypothetical protein